MLARTFVLGLLMAVTLSVPASAVVPEDVVSGIPSGGSKWFSGSLIQQPRGQLLDHRELVHGDHG